MNAELEHIWSRVQAELAQAVEESTYRIWLQPLRPRELSGGGLQIEAPADACGWICERFGRLMQASATLVLGTETAIEQLLGGLGRQGVESVVFCPRLEHGSNWDPLGRAGCGVRAAGRQCAP